MARHLKVKQPWSQPGGIWEYPTLGGGGGEGVIIVRGVVIHYLESGHSHVIHFDVTDSGFMGGGGAMARIVGLKKVVGVGGGQKEHRQRLQMIHR